MVIEIKPVGNLDALHSLPIGSYVLASKRFQPRPMVYEGCIDGSEAFMEIQNYTPSQPLLSWRVPEQELSFIAYNGYRGVVSLGKDSRNVKYVPGTPIFDLKIEMCDNEGVLEFDRRSNE